MFWRLVRFGLSVAALPLVPALMGKTESRLTPDAERQRKLKAALRNMPKRERTPFQSPKYNGEEPTWWVLDENDQLQWRDDVLPEERALVLGQMARNDVRRQRRKNGEEVESENDVERRWVEQQRHCLRQFYDALPTLECDDCDYWFEDETGIHWHDSVSFDQRAIVIEQLSNFIESLTVEGPMHWRHHMPSTEFARVMAILTQLQNEARPPVKQRLTKDQGDRLGYDKLTELEHGDGEESKRAEEVRITRRLKCDCGHVIKLNEAREKRLAGKPLKCPECGVVRTVRPSSEESDVSG